MTTPKRKKSTRDKSTRSSTRHVPVIGHWRAEARKIASDYARIRDLHSEDAGTAGSQGESDWHELLVRWLPAYYHVVKHGRIFHNGRLSGQLDVLVLDPAYPPALLNEKAYNAGGVVAAFECKTTLTSKHITDAAATARELTDTFCYAKPGTPFRELYRPYFFGILAHSHSWKSAKSNPMLNVENALAQGHSELGAPPQMIDVVCVSDLATWGSFRSWWPGVVQAGYFSIPDKPEHPRRGGAIGAFFWEFFSWLAFRDEAVERLLSGYMLGGVGGDGSGFNREWPWNKVLSPSLVQWLRDVPSRSPASNETWRGRA